MRITTKSRFAVTAMIDIALREQSGPVPLGEIALRHHISLSYLEQLFSKLRQQGLVESTRGPGGGYSLGRSAQTISMADIILAVDRASATQEHIRTGENGSQDLAGALTNDLWSVLDIKMTEHMHAIKLSSLVSEQLLKGVSVESRKTKRGVFSKPVQTPVRTTAPNSVFAWGSSLLSQN
jgi:Rrf2 family iron-sulfur cluster assembly transcriptional regulator